MSWFTDLFQSVLEDGLGEAIWNHARFRFVVGVILFLIGLAVLAASLVPGPWTPTSPSGQSDMLWVAGGFSLAGSFLVLWAQTS